MNESTFNIGVFTPNDVLQRQADHKIMKKIEALKNYDKKKIFGNLYDLKLALRGTRLNSDHTTRTHKQPMQALQNCLPMMFDCDNGFSTPRSESVNEDYSENSNTKAIIDEMIAPAIKKMAETQPGEKSVPFAKKVSMTVTSDGFNHSNPFAAMDIFAPR